MAPASARLLKQTASHTLVVSLLKMNLEGSFYTVLY